MPCFILLYMYVGLCSVLYYSTYISDYALSYYSICISDYAMSYIITHTYQIMLCLIAHVYQIMPSINMTHVDQIIPKSTVIEVKILNTKDEA